MWDRVGDEGKDEDSKGKPACPAQESECSLGYSKQLLKESKQISDLNKSGYYNVTLQAWWRKD